jgi:hypothetical protein
MSLAIFFKADIPAGAIALRTIALRSPLTQKN